MDLESVKIKVIFDGKEAQMGLRKFNRLVGNIGKNTGKVDKSFKTLGTTLRKAGLIGRALGIGTVALTMKSFADNAHRAAEEVRQLSYLSARTGVSVQKLSKTGAALESLGIKAGTYQQAVDLLSSGVSRLALGDASTVSALAAMGINAYRNGQQISGEELFAGVANYAQRQAMRGEQHKKNARQLLMQMGYAPELIEQMWGGADAFFKRVEEQAQKVGSLSDKEIQRAEELKQWTDELSTSIKITATKLGLLAFGELKVFGDALRNAVKGIGDVTTAVGEDEGLSRVAGGIELFFGAKALSWVSKGFDKLFESQFAKDSLFGSMARGGSNLLGKTAWVAKKGVGIINVAEGSSMVGEGMFDFWKGNDKASKWIYDNVSTPIGKGLLFLGDAWNKAELEIAKSMDVGLDARLGAMEDIYGKKYLMPEVGENWSRDGVGDFKIEIRQEFNGSVEPEDVKGATKDALDLSLKDVNLM